MWDGAEGEGDCMRRMFRLACRARTPFRAVALIAWGNCENALSGVSVMAIDISFDPCRFLGQTAEEFDPFTKPEPLTPQERKRVSNVLKLWDKHLDVNTVVLPDGGRVELVAVSNSLQPGSFRTRFPEGLGRRDNISAGIRSLTPDVLPFLVQLLQAADWMLMEISRPFWVVSSEAMANGLPKDLKPVEICKSVDELAALLARRGFEIWNPSGTSSAKSSGQHRASSKRGLRKP